MIVFGDSERADMVDAGGRLELDAVAVRMHEDRAALDELDGRHTGHWHTLTDDERTVALAIAVTFVANVRAGSRELANIVHDVRRRFDPTLPRWGDLDQVEAAVAVELVEGLVDRLIIEGTFPR
jgi:hypothetical protein